MYLVSRSIAEIKFRAGTGDDRYGDMASMSNSIVLGLDNSHEEAIILLWIQ